MHNWSNSKWESMDTHQLTLEELATTVAAMMGWNRQLASGGGFVGLPWFDANGKRLDGPPYPDDPRFLRKVTDWLWDRGYSMMVSSMKAPDHEFVTISIFKYPTKDSVNIKIPVTTDLASAEARALLSAVVQAMDKEANK